MSKTCGECRYYSASGCYFAPPVVLQELRNGFWSWRPDVLKDDLACGEFKRKPSLSPDQKRAMGEIYGGTLVVHDRYDVRLLSFSALRTGDIPDGWALVPGAETMLDGVSCAFLFRRKESRDE